MASQTTRGGVLILLLAVLAAIGPASMHIILPALPVIQDDFDATAAAVQLVLSLSLFSIAFATLAYGPASDRYGRRPVLLVGLGLFTAGSVVCTAAPNIEVLIAGRVLQSVGAAATMVLGRAIIRDLYDRETAARMMAYMITVMVVAPMVSPLVGGVLNDQLGWRAIFVFTVAVGVLLVALVFPRIPETLPRDAGAQTIAGMIAGFGALLRVPAFLGYAGQIGFGMGMFMAFVGAAPYVTIRVLGRPPTEFGLFFVVMSLGFMIGTFLTARVGARVGLDRMVLIGSALGVVFGALMFALIAAGEWTVWAIFLPGMGMAFANGLAMPNAQAGAISIDPRFAGTASGLLSFIQMIVGAAFAQLAGMVQDDTPLPMVVVMLVAAILALACVTLLPRLARRATEKG